MTRSSEGGFRNRPLRQWALSNIVAIEDIFAAYSGKTAVLGHTPQLDGRVLDGGHVVCIDTGCGYGGVLTAMDVGTGRIWQVGQE